MKIRDKIFEFGANSLRGFFNIKRRVSSNNAIISNEKEKHLIITKDEKINQVVEKSNSITITEGSDKWLI